MSACAENSTLGEKGRSRGGGLDRTVGIWAGEDEITEAENVRTQCRDHRNDGAETLPDDAEPEKEWEYQYRYLNKCILSYKNDYITQNMC